MTLSPASPWIATVCRESGEVLANAEIDQRVAAWDIARGAEPPRRLAVLALKLRTGAHGTALLPRAVYRTRLMAMWATLTSAWVDGPRNGTISFILRGSFSARGFVRGLEERLNAARIECSSLFGSESRLLGIAKIETDGSWLMPRIPCNALQRYKFRYLSAAGAAQDEWVTDVAEGDDIVVSFEHLRGRGIEVRVEDEVGAPISGAGIWANYIARGGLPISIQAVTGPDGIARVDGLTDVRAEIFATARGYVASQELVSVWPAFARAPVVVKLRKAGMLAGRVLKGEAPVANFEVWYMPKSGGIWGYERFEAAEDGRFVLEEVPVGEVELFATADVLGQSDVLNAVIGNDLTQAPEVELKLLPSMSGRGRIVDAESGRPLERALVRVWACVGGTPVEQRHELGVDPVSGEFRTDALSSGTARIHAEAQGYVGRSVSAFGEPGSEVDFGVVRLERSQGLRLRIVPDSDLRLDYCSAMVGAGQMTSLQLFDTDGWMEVGGLVAGPCRVDVVRADRYEEGFDFTLERGQGVVELPVRVAPGVNVVLEEGAPAEAALVRVHHRDETGWGRDTLGNLDGGREVVLPVEAARVREVEVLDANSVRLLRREVTAEERAAGTVRIGAAEEFLVRVVDRKRVPIEGTTVLVRRNGGATEVALDARTDAEGLARLAGVGWEQVEVLVFHPQRGVVPSVRARATDHRSKPLEIELEAEGRWSIDVRDGEVPLAGVQVRFLDPRHNAGRSLSDATGRATSLPFAAARFRAEAGERGYWPSALEADIQGTDLQSTLQVRRTGSAEVELRSGSTPDVQAFEVDFESIEFGERASQWIEQGRASADGGLSPDKDGRVRVDGLPRGKYRWRAVRAGEVVASGELEVPPHGIVREKIFVP